MKGRLLFVTDHVYYECDGEVYDTFGFNYEFFAPYLEVFEKVDVLCRLKSVEDSTGLVKSSGDRLEFHGTPAVHGVKWFIDSMKYFRPFAKLIDGVDAICYRIPATAAWNVHLINQRRKQPKPHIFEFVGDPLESLLSVDDGRIKRQIMLLAGRVHGQRMKAIVQSAKTGSYVSASHLQSLYPPPANVNTKAISSIRLNEEYILDSPRELPPLNPIRIVEVASFVIPKNQAYLIRIGSVLKEKGYPIELHFVGTGAEHESARALVNQLNMNDDVVFHNQVTGFDNIVRILDSCHIFCLPSYSEGVPRSMIEAMARGLVCVGTPIGGIVELIDKAHTFPLDDVEHATQFFAQLIDHSDTWMEIGERNIQKAREYGQSVLGPRRIVMYTELRDAIPLD